MTLTALAFNIVPSGVTISSCGTPMARSSKPSPLKSPFTSLVTLETVTLETRDEEPGPALRFELKFNSGLKGRLLVRLLSLQLKLLLLLLFASLELIFISTL